MIEDWRDIEGYNGRYQASNMGRVRSNRKVLSFRLNKSGYYYVGLSVNGKIFTKAVHKLVAMAFLGHVPCGHKRVINHIDHNPLNNKIDNLEEVSPRENGDRKHLNSTSKYVGVSWDKNRLRWRSHIVIEGKQVFLGRFKEEIDAHYAYQDKLEAIT